VLHAAALAARVFTLVAAAAVRRLLDPFAKASALFGDHLLGDALAARRGPSDPAEDRALGRLLEIDQPELDQTSHRLTRRVAHEQLEIDARQVTLIAALGSVLRQERRDPLLVELRPTLIR